MATTGRIVALGVLALATTLVLNAAMTPSMQVESVPPVDGAETWDRERLAEHLSELVMLDTTTRVEGEVVGRAMMARVHAYLERAFPRVHAALEKKVVGESGSLLFVWRGSDASLAPYMLAAHLDVVPADNARAWSEGPYSGARTVDGFVYGRGTMDNKVNVVGQLEAVEALLAKGYAPRRTVYLAYGGDEEVMGLHGARHLADLVRADLDAAGVDQLLFVADEGLAVAHGMVPGVPVAALVGVAEKGYMDVRLNVAMEGGHASMPRPGANAVGVLAAAVVALDANPFPSSLTSTTKAMLTALCPEMPFHLRLVMCNLFATDWLVQVILAANPATAAQLRTTTSVNILAGGSKPNVVAHSASAVLNHRIILGETTASVLAHDIALINDPRVNVTIASSVPVEPSPVSDATSPAFAILSSAIRSIFPDAAVAPGLLMASTDTKHYLGLSPNIFRFMPLRVTAADLPRIHGVNERIAVDDFVDVAAYYAQLIRVADADTDDE